MALALKLERRRQHTLIKWYWLACTGTWIPEWGPKPADIFNEQYTEIYEAIQMELGRRVLKAANWGQ